MLKTKFFAIFFSIFSGLLVTSSLTLFARFFRVFSGFFLIKSSLTFVLISANSNWREG